MRKRIVLMKYSTYFIKHVNNLQKTNLNTKCLKSQAGRFAIQMYRKNIKLFVTSLL